jgi:hypothetical protein
LLGTCPSRQIAKSDINLRIDRRDDAVRILIALNVSEKRRVFPGFKEILKQRGDTGGATGAQRLARVAQRRQIDMPDPIG